MFFFFFSWNTSLLILCICLPCMFHAFCVSLSSFRSLSVTLFQCLYAYQLSFYMFFSVEYFPFYSAYLSSMCVLCFLCISVFLSCFICYYSSMFICITVVFLQVFFIEYFCFFQYLSF